MLASGMSALPTATGSTSGGAIALAVVAVALIVAVLLWLFFRRGSIADRARTDDRHSGDDLVPPRGPNHRQNEQVSGDEALGE